MDTEVAKKKKSKRTSNLFAFVREDASLYKVFTEDSETIV